MSKKLNVAFCRLDARDDPSTGYSPVSFCHGKYGERLDEWTKEQDTLQIFMEREYLTRLAALQDEIKAKYEKLVNELKTATPADEENYSAALGEKAYRKAKKAAEEQFPGEEADYYT